jgi:hypothetical protein
VLLIQATILSREGTPLDASNDEVERRLVPGRHYFAFVTHTNKAVTASLIEDPSQLIDMMEPPVQALLIQFLQSVNAVNPLDQHSLMGDVLHFVMQHVTSSNQRELDDAMDTEGNDLDPGSSLTTTENRGGSPGMVELTRKRRRTNSNSTTVEPPAKKQKATTSSGDESDSEDTIPPLFGEDGWQRMLKTVLFFIFIHSYSS